MPRFKIVGLRPYVVDVPVKDTIFPRKIAAMYFPGLVRVISEIRVKNIDTGEEVKGFGEAPATLGFGNETPLAVYELLLTYVAPALEGVVLDADSPEQMKANIDHILSLLEPYLLRKHLNMTQAITDHMLHDVGARLLGIPVWRLLTDKPQHDRLRCLWSTAGDCQRWEAEAAEYLPLGYGIKLKLTADPDLDFEYTKRVLLLASSFENALVCADANEGYTPEGAIEYANRLHAEFGSALNDHGFFFEEPLKVDKYGRPALIALVNQSPVRIMLDESMFGIEDAEYYLDLVEKCAIDRSKLLFNIKVDKVGGLRPAQAIAKKAATFGIEVMIGGLFHSSYGKLVNCQFALSIANTIPGDGVHPSGDYVSTPLIRDFEDVEKMDNGYRVLNVFFDRPGMGTTIDEETLAQNAIQIEIPQRYLEKTIRAHIAGLEALM